MSKEIEQLTKLQEELGYIKGEISTVAMLGLVGEAGEVLAETNVATVNEDSAYAIGQAIKGCSFLEIQKKEIRKGATHTILSLKKDQEESFDKELADAFYYLNILATNRGLTIDDLAQMAHDKVRSKQAAGGSSEDKK